MIYLLFQSIGFEFMEFLHQKLEKIIQFILNLFGTRNTDKHVDTKK